MEELTLRESQLIYGGGFDEGREIGHTIGKALSGALALYGAYILLL